MLVVVSGSDIKNSCQAKESYLTNDREVSIMPITPTTTDTIEAGILMTLMDMSNMYQLLMQ